MRQISFLLIAILTLCVKAKAQNCPINIGFELGNFNNWKCYTGYIKDTTNGIYLTQSIATKGIHTIYPPYPNNTVAGRMDTFANATLGVDSIPLLCPYSGRYGAKIGNSHSSFKAQGLTYKLKVPIDNPDYRLTFYYAVVLENPVNHTLDQMPRFKVAVTDMSGNLVGNSCNDFEVTPLSSNFGWHKIRPTSLQDSVFFKPWSIGTINLSGHAGDSILISFTTTDCALGAHFGYAYVDISENCSNTLVQSLKYCRESATSSVKFANGYKTYTWWDSSFTKILGTNQTLIIPAASKDTIVFRVELVPYPNQGCTDTGKVYAIRTKPRAKLQTIYGDTVVCAGKQIQLYDSTKLNYYTSPWSTKSTNNIILNVINGAVIGKSMGTARIQYQFADSNYCVDSCFFQVKVLPADTMKVNVTASKNNIQFGTSVTFNAAVLLGGTTVTYQWFKNGVLMASRPTFTSTSLNNGDSIWCTVSGGTNCAVFTQVKSNVVVVNVVGPLYTIAGNVITPAKVPVTGVNVSVTGSYLNSAVVDNIGRYNFKLLTGSYKLKFNKSNDINKSNGISAVDVALVQAHILQKTYLNSPYKVIAADVSGDGALSALDIVYMKRMILGVDTAFPGNRLWVFVDSAYKFPSPTLPFPYKDSLIFSGLSATKPNQTMIGIKLGDVNWDWNPLLPKDPLSKLPSQKNQGEIIKEE